MSLLPILVLNKYYIALLSVFVIRSTVMSGYLTNRYFLLALSNFCHLPSRMWSISDREFILFFLLLLLACVHHECQALLLVLNFCDINLVKNILFDGLFFYAIMHHVSWSHHRLSPLGYVLKVMSSKHGPQVVARTMTQWSLHYLNSLSIKSDSISLSEMQLLASAILETVRVLERLSRASTSDA